MDITDIDYSNDTSPSIIDILIIKPIKAILSQLAFIVWLIMCGTCKDEETLDRLCPFPPMLHLDEKLGGEIKDFSVKRKEVDSEADKPKYGLVSKVKKLLGWS